MTELILTCENSDFIYQFRPSSSMKNPDKSISFMPTTEAAKRYQSVNFLNSINEFSQLLPDIGREAAFAGRS
ncbi:MAG: hypothetical protein KDI50_11795, partial [Candidatus Competibacteraceae bacterium]|nr:hypothetical protein [Candidatus Competibacteraceae bacterium]